MRPLEGVRILDFFWLGAGPVGSLALQHLGAEVIRIESQARLDKLREGGPYPGGVPDVDCSGVFASINCGKKSVTLNLANPAARAVVYRLVERCDVVTNNFKASTLARVGISYEELTGRNPRLVYITMSTMGADGPHSAYGAYGSHLAAMAGINGITGQEGELPVGLGPLVPDFSCNPFHACVAILAGLRSVRATGRPVYIDVSQLESTIHLLGPLIKQASLEGRQPERTGSRHPWRVPHGVYRCAGEDEWLALSVGTDGQWEALAGLLEDGLPNPGPDLDTFLARQAQRDVVDRALDDWLAGQDKWTATQRLLAAGVPAWPVDHLRDQLERDPVLRPEFVDVELAGGAKATVQRVPIAYRGAAATAPPPRLGEHTFEVLHGLLGYSGSEIAELMAQGALE